MRVMFYFVLNIGSLYSPSIELSIYGSTALVVLRRFSSFLIYTQSVGLLGRGISPTQGRYLHTEHKYRTKYTQTYIPRRMPSSGVWRRVDVVD
jgi:hypothetical protein